jgi:hypothetical protein
MEVIVISETIQEFDGERFYLCGLYFQHKGRRLHRVVWEKHNAAIPAGSHVHHKDGDRVNNHIGNLVLLVGCVHVSNHTSTEERKTQSIHNLNSFARQAAVDWHRTEAGKELGRKAYDIVKDGWLTRVEKCCEFCGVLFFTVHAKIGQARFCSNNCKAASRRSEGKDRILKVCPACGAEFFTNLYQQSECCSRRCAWEMRRARKKY